MEKREKFILIATIVVALYGALDFLVLSKKKSTNEKEINQNSSEMLAAITTKPTGFSKGNSGEVQDLVTKINNPWPEEVFSNVSTNQLLESKEDNTKTKESSIVFEPAMFNYTGFVVMGNNKMAIINGTDYKLGDLINGFKLSQINPDNIQVSWENIPFEVIIKAPENSGIINNGTDIRIKTNQH